MWRGKVNNNAFWESYKAKCLEKGLPPHYESKEEFNKAMNEPPKPFSLDDVAPKRDIEGWHAAEEGIDDIDVEDAGDIYLSYDLAHEKGDVHVEQIVQQCVTCTEIKPIDAFGTLRNGDIRKICKACHGKSISNARGKNKAPATVEETPVTHTDHSAQVQVKKEFKEAVESSPKEVGKVAIMELRVFHSALAMAYERGFAEGKSFDELTITEVELPVILDEVLGVSA